MVIKMVNVNLINQKFCRNLEFHFAALKYVNCKKQKEMIIKLRDRSLQLTLAFTNQFPDIPYLSLNLYSSTLSLFFPPIFQVKV